MYKAFLFPNKRKLQKTALVICFKSKIKPSLVMILYKKYVVFFVLNLD